MFVQFRRYTFGCFPMLLPAFQHNAHGTPSTTDEIENRINSYLQAGERLLWESDIILHINHDTFSPSLCHGNHRWVITATL